jgi:hypothetical protein
MAKKQPPRSAILRAATARTGRAHEFELERYRYILQQIDSVNGNTGKFLALYQTLTTSLATGALALFVGYRKWDISQQIARDGVIGVALLITLVAAFTITMLIVGMFTWLDYRREECELTDRAVYPGFRSPARPRNILRWYELYTVFGIMLSAVVFWLFAVLVLLPSML